MGKKKSEKTEDIAVLDNSLEDLLADIEKSFGENIIIHGTDLVNRPIQIIPVSPRIDIGLGGGIPEGSSFTLYGAEKCGKTVTAIDFAATCQQDEWGNREIFYFNIEGRVKKRDLVGIPGIKLDRFHIIESTPGNILSAEKYLNILERIMLNRTRCVCVIDSVSALMTEKEQISNMEDMQRADGAKLMGKLHRKLANVLPVNRNILISIMHLVANPTGYGAAYTESGGKKAQYASDVKLTAKKVEAWEVNGVQIGQTVDWRVGWSALGPPGRVVTSSIRYGMGIDKTYELMTLAMDVGAIRAAGAWIYYGDDIKVQGKENFYQWLLEHQEEIPKIKEAVEGLFGG